MNFMMRSGFVFAGVLALLTLSLERARGQDAGAPAAPQDLVQQVQAADLLADLITFTVDRADARLKDAQDYLSSIGKTQDFEQAKPSGPAERPLNYMLLFRGSLAFVEGDGAKYADPSVAGESGSQLYSDLTAAQYYNMHEFLHFNQQRQSFAAIRAYLQSIGAYDKFVAASGGSDGPPGSGVNVEPATQPMASTPEEVAKRMRDLIQFIHDTAWKEAQAKGMSQADFEKQWPQQVKAYRESVIARIEGDEPTAGGFGTSEIAGTPLPPTSQPAPDPNVQSPSVNFTQQPDVGDFRQLPTPVPSPYSNAQYRARDRSLWGMWDYGGRR